MSKYRINEPVTYLEGNKVVMHQRPADLVKIDDAVAAKLGDSVERRGEAEKPSETPKTETKPKAAEK